jgi:hypothetical protein
LRIQAECGLQDDNSVIKYADLITSFEGSLKKVCIQEQTSFPLTLGVNAFRGFLNEFVIQQKKKTGSRAKARAKVSCGLQGEVHVVVSNLQSLRKKRRRSDVIVVSEWVFIHRPSLICADTLVASVQCRHRARADIL